jgi:hypothetical protein
MLKATLGTWFKTWFKPGSNLVQTWFKNLSVPLVPKIVDSLQT